MIMLHMSVLCLSAYVIIHYCNSHDILSTVLCVQRHITNVIFLKNTVKTISSLQLSRNFPKILPHSAIVIYTDCIKFTIKIIYLIGKTVSTL
jgi:hypothetical protein